MKGKVGLTLVKFSKFSKISPTRVDSYCLRTMDILPKMARSVQNAKLSTFRRKSAG
jgi:hypothetical protein